MRKAVKDRLSGDAGPTDGGLGTSARKDGRRPLMVYLDPALIKDLKKEALDRDVHVYDMVEEMLPLQRGRVVMHWFSGTKAEAKRAAELGCYFSINQMMLEKPKGRELVQSLPVHRLLTETDGPFVEEDEGPIGPGDVRKAMHGLADLLGMPLNDARNLVVQNLVGLLN